MPRSKVVTVNGKTVAIQEKRIGELEALADKLGISADALATADMKTLIPSLLYDKLPALFPELTADDVKNAYPSEVEALVEAFLDCHFFGLKRLAGPLMSLATAGLGRK